MTYEDNVSVLCAEKGIVNPILEESLRISRLRFYDGEDMLLEVEGSSMNLAGRLFIEWLATEGFGHKMDNVINLSEMQRTIAHLFFGDRWHGTSPTHRPLIHGFKTASRISIWWKE